MLVQIGDAYSINFLSLANNQCYVPCHSRYLLDSLTYSAQVSEINCTTAQDCSIYMVIYEYGESHSQETLQRSGTMTPEGPRHALITPDDHGALLAMTAWFLGSALVSRV
jgi:hypothetical protein